MRKKEMEQAIKDGTPVAVSSYREQGTVPFSVRRATIVAIGQDRRVYSGRGWHGHISRDGVHVRFDEPSENDRSRRPITRARSLGDEHDLESDLVLVGPRDVYGPYEQWQKDYAAQEAARQQRENSANRAKERAEALASKLGGSADYVLPRGYGNGYYSGVKLSFTQAEELAAKLDRLEKLESRAAESAVPCPDCAGGERVLNAQWPSGSEPYSEKCSTCSGTGILPE